MQNPPEILADIWTSAGGDPAALNAVTLTGEEPQLPSSFRVAAAAQAHDCDNAGIDRSNGEYAVLVLVFQQAVSARDVAFDSNLVPLLGMADIIDRHIVVL